MFRNGEHGGASSGGGHNGGSATCTAAVASAALLASFLPCRYHGCSHVPCFLSRRSPGKSPHLMIQYNTFQGIFVISVLLLLTCRKRINPIVYNINYNFIFTVLLLPISYITIQLIFENKLV